MYTLYTRGRRENIPPPSPIDLIERGFLSHSALAAFLTHVYTCATVNGVGYKQLPIYRQSRDAYSNLISYWPHNRGVAAVRFCERRSQKGGGVCAVSEREKKISEEREENRLNNIILVFLFIISISIIIIMCMCVCVRVKHGVRIQGDAAILICFSAPSPPPRTHIHIHTARLSLYNDNNTNSIYKNFQPTAGSTWQIIILKGQ